MANSPARKPVPAPAPRKPAAAAPAPDPVEPAKPKKKRGRAGLWLGLLLLTGAAAAGWHYTQAASAPEKPAASEPRKQSVFVPVDTFTVNLAASAVDRYLQLGITLETS